MAAQATTAANTAERLDDPHGRYLTFHMGKIVYGIELAHVLDIVNVPMITRVPGLPNYIKGIINLRGKVAPVIDVRLKFNQPERAYDDKTCIIVVSIRDMKVGLIVDSVVEVLTIDDSESSPPPDLGINSSDKYLKSIAKVEGRGVIMNIDCEKFFQNDLNPF